MHVVVSSTLITLFRLLELLMQAGVVDPFELVLQLGSEGISAATGGCCSTQSADCCK